MGQPSCSQMHFPPLAMPEDLTFLERTQPPVLLKHTFHHRLHTTPESWASMRCVTVIGACVCGDENYEGLFYEAW